jgi:HAMP domain-containing protein
MTDSATAIMQGASAMKTDLLSDQQRLESESDATIGETERLIMMIAAGGFLLGAALALVLGKGISQPMTAMCKAMRELASGNFDVVLPGLGRRDELGEMAGAVEEFKMQAIAKAERDAAAQDAQNRASSAARRAELIRFADDFEAAVGACLERFGIGGSARTGCRNVDADRGNHAKPVQPGCRRIGRGAQQHAIGRHRNRGAFQLGQ